MGVCIVPVEIVQKKGKVFVYRLMYVRMKINSCYYVIYAWKCELVSCRVCMWAFMDAILAFALRLYWLYEENVRTSHIETIVVNVKYLTCLLYTSDAADE